MTRDPRFDILFEPIRLGPKLMKNRFYQTAHCNGAGSDFPGFQAHFRAMKADGGWGAVSTEACSIAPECDVTPHVATRLWDEGDVRNLSLMCDMLHDFGALAAVQLWHPGQHATCAESRAIPRGPSQSPSNLGNLNSCQEMDRDDIRDVRALYVEAAKRARRAGFDIITIHICTASGLPHLFLIPFFNRRQDEYGGSFENRARFSRELLEAVRDAVADDCAIAVRFGIDTLSPPAGLSADRGIHVDDDGLHFIEYCDDLVDLWDIKIGHALESGEDIGPSRTQSENHEKPFVDRVKAYTTKPVVNVGRFTNPTTMVQVILSGQADIIGGVRPSIADPFLPKKIEEGRLDDIRECIGCNICIAQWESAKPIICTQNPTSGEEYRRGWHPERFTRPGNWENDVLVVGAGPAGMECAMILGKRGMRRVHLVEAEDEIGGTMRWIPRLPGLGEWARVVNYRKIQLAKLRNVEVICKAELDARAVLDYGADIVVIATGSRWAANGLNAITGGAIEGANADLAYCFTPEQIMIGDKPLSGERMLVYDCDGYFMAAGLAERLAATGLQVTYMTPLGSLAPYTRFTFEAPWLNRRLRSLGVRILTEHVLLGVRAGAAVTRGVWDESQQELEVDGAVLVTQRQSNATLYGELKHEPDALAAAGIRGFYRVGDCVAPGLIADAIFGGHRLAQEIDSENPTQPLPYIRERRLLNQSETDFDLSAIRVASTPRVEA